jgi:hypothetical protein
VEGLHQIQGRGAQAQPVQRRPRVDDVTVVAAGLVETLEHVIVEIHAGGAAVAIAAMERASAPSLRAGAASARRQAPVIEDLSEG